MMNGYNFTERVRSVLAMAREEAARLHHEYVGTEHLLLALIREGEGVAATVLQNLEIDGEDIRSSIDERVKHGKPEPLPASDLPYASRAKKVLEHAMSQARELNHSYVGTEHLLLGLIAERNGIGGQVLVDHGVTLDVAVAETVRILDDEKNTDPRPAKPSRTILQERLSAHPAAKLSERLRDIMAEAEHVATECSASELLPIHVAVALVRHRDGMANAVMDSLGCDRDALLVALEAKAKENPSARLRDQTLKMGEYMTVLQRYVDSDGRWRSTPANTLHVLLALLDTQADVGPIFHAHRVDANRVRSEARRMNG